MCRSRLITRPIYIYVYCVDSHFDCNVCMPVYWNSFQIELSKSNSQNIIHPMAHSEPTKKYVSCWFIYFSIRSIRQKEQMQAVKDPETIVESSFCYVSCMQKGRKQFEIWTWQTRPLGDVTTFTCPQPFLFFFFSFALEFMKSKKISKKRNYLWQRMSVDNTSPCMSTCMWTVRNEISSHISHLKNSAE